MYTQIDVRYIYKLSPTVTKWLRKSRTIHWKRVTSSFCSNKKYWMALEVVSIQTIQEARIELSLTRNNKPFLTIGSE
jgi:hypothetical protein